jgi:succinate dehydrogenase / fumarate reductase cytochrome b subunit
MQNAPSPDRFALWFDPRRRHPGAWAFILNRVTALGLTLYLFLHLYMLSKLAQGPQAYDNFIVLVKAPLIKASELLVIAGGLIHGLNGIRVALTSFGIGVTRQKEFFWIGMAISCIGILFFAYKMFLGD